MADNELMLLEKPGIRIVSCPHPFKVEQLELFIPEGASLQEILEKVQPDPILRTHAYIQVNSSPIPRKEWKYIYPFESDIVTIRIVPTGGGGGGGGKNPLKAVMTIGIIAASLAFGPQIGLALLPGIKGVAIGNMLLTTIVGKVIIGGIGMLISNALIPPRSPTSPGMPTLSRAGGGITESPTLFIEGARNSEQPFGILPVILGVHKHVPPLLSKTITEIVGVDQYLRMIVTWGAGRIKVDSLEIGDTLLQEFDDVDIETVEGVSGQPNMTLFPDIGSEENFSILLKQANGFTTRTSPIGVDELSVDVIFVRGLVTFDDSGNRNNRTVTFEMQFRETGTAGSWLNPNLNVSGATNNNAVVTIKTESTLTRLVKKDIGKVRYKRTIYVEESYTQILPVHDSVTDTGSQQVITTGINPFTSAGIITATVTGGGSVIDAVQIIIVGTDTSNNAQNETLPAFINNTPGIVRGTKIFKTVTQITYPAQSSGVLSITVTNNKSSAVRYGFRWKVGTRAQYDVRIQRTTSDSTSTKIFDELTWTALRSFVNEDPDNFPIDIAKTAISIKATNQLSNIIDNLSAKVSSYVLNFTGAGWTSQISSNPASLFRHVLQSGSMAIPLADSRIDLDTLETWHTFCVDNGFEFNMIRDYQSSVWEVLIDICIAGRASPIQIDGKWSVVIDKLQTVPTQHFTNKNSWGFEAEKDFPDLPHALRVRFANRNTDWRQDERIVYADGFTEATATKFEEIDALGMTDPDHVWKFARFNLAQMSLRPEKWYLNVDFEYLVSMRGDLVLITHDVLLIGLASGRIKSIETDSSEDVLGITVDEGFTMEAGKNYGVSIRTRDNVELTKTLVLDVGDQTTITFDSVIPAANAPVVGDLLSFGIAGAETIEGLLLSIETLSNLSARLIITPYSSAIYTADTGTIPEFISKLTPQAKLPDVVIIDTRTDESVLRLGAGNTLIPRIGITHEPIDSEFEGLIKAQIRLTSSGLPFTPVTISFQSSTEIIIEDIEQGETYDVKLRWTSRGRLLQGAFSFSNNITVIGTSNPPSPLANLTIVSFGNTALLQWDPLGDLDVRFGGIIKFRFSHETNSANASWNASVSIGSVSKGSDTMAQLPLKTGTYLARVFDKGDRVSTVVKIDTKQASVIAYAAATNITEETTFTGIHNNTIAIDNVLKLIGAGLIDDIVDIDLIVNWDSEGGIVPSGTYDFAAGFDLTTVKPTRITTDINMFITNVIDLIDGRTDLIDIWESFDGDISGEADARVQVRVTDDDPDDSNPDFSVWNNVESAEYNNRGFDFRLQLTSNNTAFNPVVNKLQVNSEEPS